MTGPLYRLGKLVVRRARWFLAGWILAAIVAFALVNVVGKQTSDDLTLPGSDSTHAVDLLDRYLPNQANGTIPVVLETTDGKRLDEGANKKAVEDTKRSLENNQYVHSAVSPLSAEGSDNLAKGGQIGYVSVTLTLGTADLDEEEAEAIVADATGPAEAAGLDASVGSYLGQKVSKPATESSEAIGIAVAIVVLLFAFGTATAMPLPIVTAIFALVIGLSLVGFLGHLMEVPSVAPTLGTMLGLGVGIDYSLFIITRQQGLMKQGHPVDEAIARAVATSGGAIVFAGSTVIVALVSLYFSGIPIVRALGYSAAVVVFVAVLAAITLLPAILGLLGDRIKSLKVPWLDHEKRDQKAHGWERWARGVGRHQWVATIVATAILLGLAIPLFDITLGQPDNSQLPTDTETRQSYDALTEGFTAGSNGPLLVAVEFTKPAKPNTKKLNRVDQQQQQQQQQAQQAEEQYQQAAAQAEEAGEPPPPPPDIPQPTAKQQQEQQQQKEFLKSSASDPRLVKLENQISKDPDVYSVSQAKVDDAGKAAVISVVPDSAPSAYRTQDLVNHLRDDVIPDTLDGTGAKAFVGGTTAGYIDLADRIGEKLPLVIAIVVGLSFLLLMLAFRSIVVPLTAGIMNLLSVAASYGVLVAVFEKGVGLSLIGLDRETPIVSFVPLLMFAILFGLSMDYQVFLLTRISEHWKEVRDNHEAVVEGLASTARVITSAAMIMVAVFTSFVLNGDPTVKQFGVGLAVAIAIDATVVRCLLVPAVMIIFGRANWWLPGFLERHLPNVGIEGDEYFAAKDAAASTGATAAAGSTAAPR